jgi:hypothetical protein
VVNPEAAYLESVLIHQYTFISEGMKDQFERKLGIGHFELKVENFDQPGRTVEVELLVSAQQAHARDQANQAKIMIPVQVRDENMIDAASPDLVFVHLCLCALSAIHEEEMVVERNHLGCGVPVESRYGRIISKYGYREHR